ncbi:MAG TPA: tetratricopeptide repeat protein [Gaiellaceae bacterium]|nr:tetratricopeptide repeat protein [Gaiellaceae bacterium]
MRQATATAKTTVPAVPALAVRRPALEARLDEAFGRRVTVVVAGPGFGKTTLLASWAADVECAWYTITREDVSVPVLARGLAEALRSQLGDALAETLAALGPAPNAAADRERAASVASLLTEALERSLAYDVVLIIDDLDRLTGAAAARLIEELCRQAPPTLHVVLASRAEPPFPLARLRKEGDLLELDAAALAFQPGEVEELLAESLWEAHPDLAQLLQEATQGWPGAVRLALDALETAPPAEHDEVLRRLRRPGGALFTYLAESVLGREPAAVREALSLVSVLEGFAPAVFTAICGPRSGEVLERLVRRGLLAHSPTPEGGWYRPHALVREFVLERWPVSDAERRRVFGEAARWSESLGDSRAALHAAASARDVDLVAGLLARRGHALLEAGSVADVLEAAALVPVERRQPGVEEVVGAAHALRGEWQEALACLERAGGGCEAIPAGLAWRIGRIHFERGDLSRALESYRRAIRDGTSPRDEALVLAATVATHFSLGEAAAAHDLADETMAAAVAANDPRALAAAHNAMGLIALAAADESAATAHFDDALDAAEAAGDVLQVIRIRINRAGPASPPQAIRDLEPAVALAEVADADLYLGAVLNARAMNTYFLGRFDESIADLERARAIFDRLGSKRLGRVLAALAHVHRERGDLTLARTLYTEALALAERTADAQGLVDLRAGFACALAAEDPDAAAAVAEQAVDEGRRLQFWLVRALLAAGWVALVRGEAERAGALAAEAFQRAHDSPNRADLAEALELDAFSHAGDADTRRRQLEEALSVWRELGNRVGEARVTLAIARTSSAASGSAERAERRLREAGVRIEAAASAAGLLAVLPPTAAEPVAIRTLGGFVVLRDGQPVAVTEWQSKKARDLLKLLVARRGHPVPRETLMEALWPGEDPARLGNRFSVAISTARSVLDPERRFPAEHFVDGDKASLRLDLAHVEVDVELFLREAEDALRLARAADSADAQEALALAEERYAGEFLEDDPYEDWAAALREEARAAYMAVARELGALHALAGDADAAERYLLRVLARDPHDEEAHLALVDALAHAGRHGEARRRYRMYVDRMAEIEIEPAPLPAPRRGGRGVALRSP